MKISSKAVTVVPLRPAQTGSFTMCAALCQVMAVSGASVALHSATPTARMPTGPHGSPRAVDSAGCSVPTEVDFNATRTFRRFPAPNLVPWPVAITASAGYVDITPHTTIVALTREAAQAAHLLAADIAVLTAGELNLTVVEPPSGEASAIQHPHGVPSVAVQGVFEQSGSFNASSITLAVLPSNAAYSTVTINASGSTLTGQTYEALVASCTTLLQALEHSRDTDSVTTTRSNCTTAAAWRLPFLVMTDAPEFDYRGLMVDAARNEVPVADLQRFVDICRFYKLNFLHIHLSDDQAFTFPSTAFPQLATKSAFRYSLTDLQRLKAYADTRGVQIVGEIDVPGHSTACVRALPELFGFPSAPTLGVVNFVNASIVSRLQTIFNEIDDLFHSPFIAIGGDEVDFAALQNLPEVKAALHAQQLQSVSDLYRKFITEMQAYAVSRNKTLRVWEGFGPQSGQSGHKPVEASAVAIPPQEISVSVFDGCYYNPPRLAADGYRIINSNTAVLYINEPTSVPEMIYSWHPWLFGDLAYSGYESWWELPLEHRGQVDGVQICAWGMSADAMIAGMRAKAPAMSDRSWNPQAMRSYQDFQARIASTDAKIARLLALAPPPGPPAPPPPGPPAPPGEFSPERGACRDAPPSDAYSSPRIETRNVLFSVCIAKCEQLGQRCDAFDIDAPPPKTGTDPVVSWCGVWGTLISPCDVNATDGWTYYCDGECGTESPRRVCRGDTNAGQGNTCYAKAPTCA